MELNAIDYSAGLEVALRAWQGPELKSYRLLIIGSWRSLRIRPIIPRRHMPVLICIGSIRRAFRQQKLHGSCLSVVSECTHLDWLMLTKRLLPHLELGVTPARLLEMFAPWPEHVWFGHTLANQHEADLTMAAIAQIPAPVRFISHELFLGPIDYVDYDSTPFLRSALFCSPIHS